MSSLLKRFVADDRGVVMGLTLWSYTLILAGLFVVVVGGLFFADAQVRIHATQTAEAMIDGIAHFQSAPFTDERLKETRPLKEWSEGIAEKVLAKKRLPGLQETIIRYDLERVTPHQLRLTIVTEASFDTGLLRLFGIGAVKYRGMSAQEAAIDCMPSNLPSATGPKGPAIVRRNTGLLDKILLRGEGDVDVVKFASVADQIDDEPSPYAKDGCSPTPTSPIASTVRKGNGPDVPFRPDVSMEPRRSRGQSYRPSEAELRWSSSSQSSRRETLR